MPKNVIVVGMPRSGTSLVAGVFARQGYFAAADPDEELRSGDHHNPGGYWEAAALTRLNAALFAEAGHAEDTTWLGEAISAEAAARLDRLPPTESHRDLVRHYQERAPWVWKDPRLCYTLGFWWPLVDDGNTHVILTRRDPEAIWRSFVRLHWREATPEAKRDVLERIEGHLAAARSAIDRLGIPHLEVRYEAFAADPIAKAQKLSAALNLDLSPGDLGFSGKLNHATLRGRLATYIEHRYERLPPVFRRAVKHITPAALFRALYPERRSR